MQELKNYNLLYAKVDALQAWLPCCTTDKGLQGVGQGHNPHLARKLLHASI
jgi:hypothetical protein